MSFSVSELRSRHSRSLLILGLATFNAAGLAMTGLPFWLLWATPDPGLGQGGRLFMLGYLWALTWLFTWLAQRRFDFEEDFRGWSVALTGVGWGALYGLAVVGVAELSTLVQGGAGPHWLARRL